MQNSVIVLKGCWWSYEGVGYRAHARNNAAIHFPPKGTTVFVFMILISLVAAGSIVGTVVAVNKDGYGRVPERKLVRSF